MRGTLNVVAVRGTLLACLWWALTEGQPGTWVFGAIAVAISVGASLALGRGTAWQFRPVAAARFALGFLHQSLTGGIDVAWRALGPGRALAPEFLEYRLRLPEGAARIFFANTVSLLPGTLSASLQRGGLRVHILDDPAAAARELSAMEERVAALFGVALGAERGR